MSLFNTRREKLHMERMEDAANLAARVECDRTNAMEEHYEAVQQHNAEMLKCRKEEINNQVYTLTLKGDEARDYNEWKCLRDKHKEILLVAGILQTIAHHVDQAIESWMERKPTHISGYTPAHLMEFVKYNVREINYKLHPILGKGVLDTNCFEREKTENIITKLLENI